MANELTINRWLEEAVTESSASEEQEDDTSEEQTIPVGSPHVSDTEQESDDVSDDDDENVPLSQLAVYESRNGTKWSKIPPVPTRTRAHNIMTRPSGPKGIARDVSTPIESFLLFFDSDILTILVESTNIYIDTIKHKYQRDRDAKPTDLVEMKAFVGLLLLIGVCRAGRRNLKDFWDNSQGLGIELVYTTMSKSRFRFLLRCVRFDDVRDRSARQSSDRLAAIRQIIEIMLRNCKQCYTPSECVTLDEQLVAFKGRCAFIVYMPNKPCKFGIKIIMAVDVKYPFVCNFEVYAGQHPEGPYRLSNQVPDIIHRVLEPLYDLGCNVTMDNWFTSVPVSKDLLQKRITVVGTLKKNKPEIPQKFKSSQNREILDSAFGFQPNCTLVSYVPKKNKVVLLLSTLHNDANIDPESGEAKKPEIITYYNHTKYGVDVFDKMCRQYDVTRNTRRWPLILFYNFLNMAGINGLVIYQLNNPQTKTIRRKYLQEVGYELVKPQISRRISQETIPRAIKLKARLLLGLPENPQAQNLPIRSGKGRCDFCSRRRDRTTRKTCAKCNRRVCPDHQITVCPNCDQVASELE